MTDRTDRRSAQDGIGNSPVFDVVSSREADLAAFDLLPPGVRRVVDEAVLQWDAAGVLAFHEAAPRARKGLTKTAFERQARERARVDAWAMWGEGHPAAVEPRPDPRTFRKYGYAGVGLGPIREG